MLNRREMLDIGNKAILWSFSSGYKYSSDLKKFIQNIPACEENFDQFPSGEAGVQKIKKLAEGYSPKNISWFEIGVNSNLVANMVTTNAPDEMIELALAGYRLSLEEVGFSIEVRDKIFSEIKKMQSHSKDKKALHRLHELIRQEATDQDTRDIVKKNGWLTENMRWIIGIIVPIIFAGSAPAWINIFYPEDNSSKILWEQNWQQIQEPIPTYCSPCYSNRERLLSILSGIKLGDNDRLKELVSNTVIQVKASPEHPSETFYNVSFPPELRESFSQIRQLIRNEAIENGVSAGIP